MFQPVIKWSGSKRSQADEIIKYFPTNIDTYYKPFIDGDKYDYKSVDFIKKLIRSILFAIAMLST